MTRCTTDPKTAVKQAVERTTATGSRPRAPHDGHGEERRQSRESATADLLWCLRGSLLPEGFQGCLNALPDDLLFLMASYARQDQEDPVSERAYSKAVKQLLDLNLRPCAALAHLVRLHMAIREAGRTDVRTKRLMKTFEREFHADDDPIARWLYHEGLLTFAKDHPRRREAVKILDAQIERFHRAPDTLSERVQYYDALLERGFLHGQQGRNQDALADYRSVMDGCLHAEEPELKWMGARALTNTAVRLKRMGRLD